MSEGEGQEGVLAIEAEFGADVRAVVFDGANADEHLFSDLFIGHRFRDQEQNPSFRSGEIINGR